MANTCQLTMVFDGCHINVELECSVRESGFSRTEFRRLWARNIFYLLL